MNELRGMYNHLRQYNSQAWHNLDCGQERKTSKSKKMSIKFLKKKKKKGESEKQTLLVCLSSSICLLYKYLLSTYYVWGAVLDARAVTVYNKHGAQALLSEVTPSKHSYRISWKVSRWSSTRCYGGTQEGHKPGQN